MVMARIFKGTHCAVKICLICAISELRMRRAKIAVVGGGAKAVAIAARARVMADLKLGVPIDVTIFEKSRIGANWTGDDGYTDGVQQLCTPIERDLGFPYHALPDSIAEALYRDFSWPSYLINKGGVTGGEESFSKWVDHGCESPEHREFAAYLHWAAIKARPNVILQEVTKLIPIGQQWQVESRLNGRGKLNVHTSLFDGVVVTGPGPSNRVRMIGAGHRVFDGQQVWVKLKKVKSELKKLALEDSVAIIGAGGTAAAILAWLMGQGQQDRLIHIVADQPAFFSRGDSVFENRVFNDELAWTALSKSAKQDFVNRLSRGVVWDTVMDRVSKAKNINFVYGRARLIKSAPHGLELHVKTGSGDLLLVEPSLIFDAAGFDSWWWTKLIDDSYFRDNSRVHIQDDLTGLVDDQLAFTGAQWKWPNLHAPMVATAVGPGYASLLSLGKVADRVLSRYLTGVK
ncbi:SidA/IucD/PvdA family monooxygenase [Xanthomonas bonasiae]|uniref:SidA/IucD/PvdA family monooxygenase n=1 Tax=Xanthomonas bonasiae TaxID=2810351 RepID=UPI00197FBC93|nr:SidA/IucD/PvdA family monooxygenase [Xanthomonas bonasiae]MBN6111404.1 SidA/IucD/PvdA family monooxygenase [Xanthomonas bonasiae]